MFLLFLLLSMFGKAVGMDIYTFSEAMSLGTLLEEKQEICYETYLRSLEDAQKTLQRDPQCLLYKEFVDIVYHKEIPTSFAKLDTFKLHSSFFGEHRISAIIASLKITINKRAQEKQCSAEDYFVDLQRDIYKNRSTLIDALKHNDKETIAQFIQDRQKYPWHLLHILPAQEWHNFKNDLERTRL